MGKDPYLKDLIDTGKHVWKILRDIYFKEEPWCLKTCTSVTDKFDKLIKKIRIYHPELQYLDHLKVIIKYSEQDIREAIDA